MAGGLSAPDFPGLSQRRAGWRSASHAGGIPLDLSGDGVEHGDGAFAGPLQDGGLDEDAAWGEGPAVVAFGGDEFGQGPDVVLWRAEPAPVSGADPGGDPVGYTP